MNVNIYITKIVLTVKRLILMKLQNRYIRYYAKSKKKKPKKKKE